MSDDSTTTIRAIFATRAAADLAVEHLVQQHGLARSDIFLQSATDRNTAGSAPSGGDISADARARGDSPLEGRIELSADIAAGRAGDVRNTLRDAGALQVSDAE